GAFLGEEGHRGWGPVGGEQEEVGANLMAVSCWAGTACGGGAAKGGGGGGGGWGVQAWGLRWEVRKGVVGSNWVEEGRRRSSTGAGGRWQLGAAAAAPRRWRRDEAGPRSSSRAVWWWFGARWRREWAEGRRGELELGAHGGGVLAV